MNTLKRFVAVACMLGIISTAGSAFAQETANVDVTVQLESVEISVTDGTVDFGALSYGGDKMTSTASDSSDTQTIENTGTLDISIVINGTDSIDWALVLSSELSVSVINQFAMQYRIDGMAGWEDLTTTPTATIVDLMIGETAPLDLFIVAPSAGSALGSQSVMVELLGVQI